MVLQLSAVMQSQIPWASIIVRKGFCSRSCSFCQYGYVLSPSAETGALPVEGGVAIAFKNEIEIQ